MRLDENTKEKKEEMYKKSEEIIKLMVANENDELIGVLDVDSQ